MRRFLSIAICSVAVAQIAVAQSRYIDLVFPTNGSLRAQNTAGPVYTPAPNQWPGYAVFPNTPIRFLTSSTNNVWLSFGLLTTGPWQGYSIPYSAAGGSNDPLRVVVNSNLTEWTGFRGTNAVTNGFVGGVPPLATNSFSWTFGPEWAGAMLQIKATNGMTLGTWGLPSQIGSNYVLSSSIITNASLLNGAQVYLDGIPVSVLAMLSTNSNVDGVADRPGYSFEFDSTYQGGEWQARRPDGSIAASGSAATLGTALSGRITVAEGQSAEVYTRVPAGDGMGSVWLPTGVTLQGGATTTYAFVNNPTPQPVATPSLPNPTPAPSPSPAPSAAPTPGTNNSVVSPSPTPGQDVTVDVEEFEPPSVDAGEEDVIESATSAGEKVRVILQKAEDVFSNVALTYGEFNKLAFGGVGKTCTLNFGPVVIDLGGLVPEFVRSGMKLVILLTWAVGLYRIITWTFS